MKICQPKFKPFPWNDLPLINQKLYHVASAAKVKALADKGTEELYWYCIDNNVNDPWLIELLKPSKTIWNRIGELAASGTDCPCCLGYRAITGFLLGTGVGICLMYLIG